MLDKVDNVRQFEMKTALPISIRRAFAKSSVLRARELESLGLWRAELGPLVRHGVLVRSGRGLYMLPTAKIGEHHTLAEAAKRVPRGVVCLLSALRFHGLTTQHPHEVWLALDGKARHPAAGALPLRIVRSSGVSLQSGQEEHVIEGVPVKIYSPAKTVADCFKFRNKIGLDVALEALRETWMEKRCGMDDLIHYARVCRVANVMRPYLESLS